MDESLKRRVVIEGVTPEIDCGRFPVKRAVGETVTVEADAFTDGHDRLTVMLLHRPEVPGTPESEALTMGPSEVSGTSERSSKGASSEVPGTSGEWTETPMEALGNDRFRAGFPVLHLGRYRYTVEAWIDRFGSWRRDFEKRIAAGEAGEELAVDLRIGAELLRAAAGRVPQSIKGARGGPKDAKLLRGLADGLAGDDLRQATALALDPETEALAGRHPDREAATRYHRELAVVVDRERARFSTWYETFPRSTGEGGRHGTFADLEKRLPYIAGMGFDVLYLPPIHPIGTTHRKGRNNARVGRPGDVGSPWAIGDRAASAGSGDGGHKSIHPDLGTPSDFRRLVAAAAAHGLEIALDVAFQCSPDHPYVHEHPEWFRKRPDGTIQYAENPPKKYEDIVPFDFECADWRALWEELESVFLHWIGEGVTIFRVDNPHTKSLRFWEWAIARIKARHPETIFLSEAFTRPKVMFRLAKLGFTQSYNYFPWRNGKHELTEYLTELTRTEVAEYFRPNLWPNTPDILTEVLQTGGRPAFTMRFLLAATLGASYGIYGPPFELMDSTPREPGSEEYLDSEKYQLRDWGPRLADRADRADSLAELIARVNRARREHPALQTNATLRFHGFDNPQVLGYSKTPPGGPTAAGDTVLAFVNLDPHHVQSGWTDLDLAALGLEDGRPFHVHDLLTGARYLWEGRRNYVELDPHRIGAHLFRIGREARSEEDFDTF